MSVNPADAGALAAAGVAAVEALVAAELDALAADAQTLQSKLVAGQVVTAQILPSNGLTDLINIMGSRVAASLPPGLAPGDLFTAQVTGFNGPQILLQIVDSVEPAGLAEPPPVVASPQEAPAQSPLPAGGPAAPPAPGVPPVGTARSVAPPQAVFVAASVRQAAAGPPPAAANAPLSAAPALAPAPPVAPALAPATALSPAAPVLTPPVLAPPSAANADLEGRLAAARTGTAGPNAPVAPPPAPAAAAAPLPGQNPGRFAVPPAIVPSARFAAAPAAGGSPAPVTGAPGGASEPASGPAAYRDPVSLVRALGLPVTPTTTAAARLALETPQRLPAALATLASALPQSDDPRVATLRTLTAWLGKIEPGSPQLAAQISSFVDNVVTGNEPKLVQLLTAQLAAEQPATPPGQQPAASGQPESPALPVVALAQIAERGAALSVDLKTQLLALIAAPEGAGEGSGDLIPAAASALTAITSVQLNAAHMLNAQPQTLAFTLPMWLGSGYAQARIAIDRDAPDGASRSLDGDNFHIAFVLDTPHLGTVAIDLHTVGRAFSLAVKTESESSAQRLGGSLDRLTDRLETLRYRVNSAAASVAQRGAAAAAEPAPAAVPSADDDGGSAVNMRA